MASTSLGSELLFSFHFFLCSQAGMTENLNRAMHDCILRPPAVLTDTVECQESRFACPQQAGGTDITNNASDGCQQTRNLTLRS
jgi:hypothetical protein